MVAQAEGAWPRAETLAIAILADPTMLARRRRDAAFSIAAAQAARGRITDAERSLRDLIATMTAETRAYPYWAEMGRLLLSAASARGAGPPPAPAVGNYRDTTDWLIVRGLWRSANGNTDLARRDLRALRQRVVAKGDPTRNDISLLEASIASREGRWNDVVRLIGPSAWRGEPGFSGGGLTMRRWLVAEAHERARRPDSAAAYFELLVTPTRTVWWDQPSKGLVLSFVHHRLARLYAQIGHAERAKRHRQAFLETFTDPDPEFRALVAQARNQLPQVARGQ
jgi:hypothetical protein